MILYVHSKKSEKKKPIILGQGRPDLMVRQAPEKTKDKQAEKETPTETAPKVAGPPTARGGPVPPMGPLSSKSGPPPPTQASAVAPPAASNMLFSEDADGLCRACLQGDVGTVKKILGKVNPNSANRLVKACCSSALIMPVTYAMKPHIWREIIKPVVSGIGSGSATTRRTACSESATNSLTADVSP